MLLTSDLNPTTAFSRISNEVIFDDRLSHAEFRLWCRLLALPKGAGQLAIDVNDLADQLEMSTTLLRVHRSNLKAKGFMAGDKNRIVVTMPSPDFKPKEPKLTPDQALRNELRETWMSSKPDIYSRQRHPLTPAQVSTLKLHAEHNEQADLCKFLAAVLKGCKADPWWSTHGMSFNNIFGTGTPKQNKFTNVEKLFKLAGSTKGQAALFDENDDGCWLDWYQSKGHEMTKVVRLEMEQDDAWVHQVDNAGDGTIYVYSHEGRLVHWTMKEGQHGVSYLPTAR